MSVDMKDSGIAWIGEIPRHWKVSAIKRNLQLYSGATPKTDNEEYWNGNIAWITPADYKTEDRWIEQGSRYITDKGFKSCAVSILPKGSVIFSKRAPIGLVVMNSSPLCTNQGCIGCIPLTGNGSFYYYAMSICTEQFELLGSGTTFKEISATSFANFLLPTPSIVEQSLIANFLDKKCTEIDELIALQDQMIAQLTTYKQAVITETVTKGLDPNVKMKDSGVEWIGEIPEHWDFIPLKYLGRTQNGISKGGDYFGEGYPFVNYGDIYKNYFIGSNDASGLAKSTIEDQKNYSVVKGDVFFTRTSETIEEIGFSCACIETIKNATFSGFLIRFRPYPEVLYPLFSGFYFRSTMHRQYFVKEMNIVTRTSLGQDLLKGLPVLLPPLSEQQSIANYLDQKCKEIDELISVKKEKIEQLKAYKKSVIYEYVTGKKQVN